MSLYTPVLEKDMICKENIFSGLAAATHPFILYKGIKSDDVLHDYYQHDPSKSIRPSATAAENGNSYNLLLNNLPDWKVGFPLRERSIILSTSETTARSFAQKMRNGRVYAVFPEVGSILAIAPASDIWYCFQKGFSQIADFSGIFSLKRFNACIKELADYINVLDFDKDWQRFLQTLDLICSVKPTIFRRLSGPAREVQRKLYLQRHALPEFLNRTFSPTINQFKTEIYGYNKVNFAFDNNEVWTDSSCILIELNLLRQTVDKIKTHNI